jgi:hypothetical protein
MRLYYFFQCLVEEVRSMEGRYKDVVILSENVLRYK